MLSTMKGHSAGYAGSGLWLALAFCLTLMMMVPLSEAWAEATTGVPAITHDPIPWFNPGARIVVSATVKHPDGVLIARCYFKEKKQADFVFIWLEDDGHGLFRGVLPSPSQFATAIDYSILVVTGGNAVYKTETVTVPASGDSERALPIWQHVDNAGPIRVSTELPEAPSELAGFSDNITMDVVESSLRFAGTGTVISAATTESGSISSYWVKEFSQAAPRKLWYHHWWVWAGAAVITGTTVAIVASGGGESGSDDSGTVSVTW